MRRWKGALISVALVGVSVVVATTPVTAAPTARSPVAGPAAQRVYFPSHCGNSKFRPRTIVVACGDAGFIIERISWSRWGRKAAKGHGTAVTKTCVPSCASGEFVKNPVAVRLSSVRHCNDNGRLQYTRLRYRFGASDPTPPGYPSKLRFPCDF